MKRPDSYYNSLEKKPAKPTLTRQQLEDDIKVFLALGGQITQCKMGQTARKETKHITLKNKSPEFWEKL